MSRDWVRNTLKLLPKAQLHLHLLGAVRRETLLELCESQGVTPPHFPEGNFDDFSQFQQIFDAIVAVVSTHQNYCRVLREVIEDQVAAGCSHVEVHVMESSPGLMTSLHHEATRVGALLGVTVGLIACVVRSRDSPTKAEQIAADAVTRAAAGECVVGLGLAGAENDPAPFEKAFEVAKRGGLLCVPHQGEFLGPQSVQCAVKLLRADRIGHGISSVSSQSTMALLRETGVCCEVCPTSNVRLKCRPYGDGAPPVSISTHPLPVLLRAGVACCLSTDDQTLFGASLLDEYEHCYSTMGLQMTEIAQLARFSFEHSCLNKTRKTAELAKIDRWLERVRSLDPIVIKRSLL